MIMLYPYITMKDDTEVAFSDIVKVEGQDTLTVYFEKPVITGFVTAECTIPSYRWNVKGLTEPEIAALQVFVKKNESSFFKFAKQGGVGVYA